MRFLNNIIEKYYTWEANSLNKTDKIKNPSFIKLNPFTLSFPKEMEKSFLSYYYENSILQINISLLSAAFFFAIFFIFDLYLIPELFYEFLALRIIGSWTIIFSSLLIINKSHDKKISQPVLTFATILIGILDIVFIIIASPKLNSSYYVGIILIYFWTYVFLKLRFRWATVAGFSILLFYIFSEIKLIYISPDLFFVSTSYLFASNLAGATLAYTIEYNSRKDYFRTLILKKSLETNLGLNAKISENEKIIDKAEEKLMLQSKALESAANSIIIMDNKGSIIFANTAFLELTGYSYNEVIGKNPRILKSGKHDADFYNNLWTTILQGKVWSGELINKKKNGQLYYEEMVITPVTNNGSKEITQFIAIKQNITSRKKMEEEIQDSEKRFRSLFENAVMGIYKSTPSGEVLMANDALIKMLGFDTIDELKNWRNITIGYSDPKQRNEFVRLIDEKGMVAGLESEWIKKDGTKIFIRESAVKNIESGETVYEGTVEDISMNKMAEAELKASRERIQKVLDNVYDAIFIHDINGKIIEVNNKVLDLYNISREEALQINIMEISAEKNPFDNVSKIWQEVIQKEKSFKFEWKALRPNDKTTFDVEVFLSKIYLGDKHYVLANVRDITDQKEANKNLLINKKAVELNVVPIYWLTKDAKFIYANNAGVNKLGYSLDELLQKNLSEVDLVWSKNYWDSFGYKMLKENKVTQFESAHLKKNGEKFPVEVIASVINYENEEVIIQIVNDITERQKVKENLVRAKETAEQSNKLKSEFLAGMSHEIRTPINTILNFVSLIKSDLGENVSEDIAYSFDMINSGSRRLIRTIDSILNMSQLQSGAYETKFEVFSIEEQVLKKLYQEYKIIASQKGLKLELEVSAENPKIYADMYTITQLFINLIDNAIKYTKEGGITIVVMEDENCIITKVKDTGIGISEKFLPTLFEPFLQEEMGYTRSFEGNGLGLALVKKYIEINNGTIEVESKKGAGSTFSIKFNKLTERELNVNKVLKAID